MTETKQLHFYWDIGSTNTYFAFHLIKPLIRKYEVELVYHPFNLGYVFRAHDYQLMDEPRPKLSNRRRDLQRWAAHYQLPFRMPDQFPIKTSTALRGSLVMRELGLEQAYLEALFQAYWENNDASIATYDGLERIAASLDLAPADFRAACEAEPIRDALIQSTDEALADGIFGAPTIKIDDEIYWGKDRMDFVEAHLAGNPALPPRA